MSEERQDVEGLDSLTEHERIREAISSARAFRIEHRSDVLDPQEEYRLDRAALRTLREQVERLRGDMR